ncbi:MAG: LysM peptidoglycan-binding domain-containing protein [Bernardetiaceae bacterium]|nr:LysM peptidoglycan-binding domain-containing protein [Bernardetiaceae bacterium]
MQRLLSLLFISIIFLIVLPCAKASVFSALSECYNSPKDSIGLERYNNRLYIRHRVEIGEDIAEIARIYRVNVRELIRINPVASQPLKIGQIIRIPYSEKRSAWDYLRGYKVQKGDTMNGIARRFGTTVAQIRSLNAISDDKIRIGQELVIETQNPSHPELYTLPPIAIMPATSAEEPDIEPYLYHEVKAGETLYKLAERYNVDVKTLNKWNRLDLNNEIKIGQKLIVGLANEAFFANTFYEAPQPTDKQMIRESGVGARMPTRHKKYWGLHQSAPIDSFVYVTNESNGKTLKVRIIGNLTNTDMHKNLIIKLSDTACDYLGFLNERFPVVLSREVN